MSYVGGSYRVERAGRAAILEYLSSAIHAQCISVHQGGHPEIRLTSPTSATGTWYQNDWFLDLRSNTKLSGACLYDDRYVKEGGDWKIEHTGLRAAIRNRRATPGRAHGHGALPRPSRAPAET